MTYVLILIVFALLIAFGYVHSLYVQAAIERDFWKGERDQLYQQWCDMEPNPEEHGYIGDPVADMYVHTDWHNFEGDSDLPF